MPLAPGTVLRSRYQISEVIGQGGMGRVYLADDLRLEGRRCAIKAVLPHPFAPAPEADGDGPAPEGEAHSLRTDAAREQFRHEARVLATLDHPNLPKVSDYFSVDDCDYVVMDFVAGQDLKAIVADARQRARFLPEHQVLMWADQLCDALTYLHNQEPPVVHRDVKPANIKLTPAGQIKLVDFGLVKSGDPEHLETVTVVRGVGSLAYTPLEQFSGEPGHAGVRSDIYALGATLYHLLTGQAPPTAQAQFLRPGALVAPSEVNPAISVRVEEAILRAMALHPAGRPASVEEFRRLLFAEPAAHPVDGGPAGSAGTLAEASRGWDWAAILRANALLIVAALAMLAWALFVTFR